MDSLLEDLPRQIEAGLMLPLCLLAVLIVHELGHYLAARILGLHVEHVIFGRGRLLFSHTDKRGTEWRLHLVPLRAHVQIAEFENSSLPMHKKLFVVLAGPFANFVFPAVLFFMFFLSFGQPVVPTIITAIEPALPAYKAGLRSGDQILSIDQQDVRSMDDILVHTSPRPSKPLDITYRRGSETFTASVLPVWTKYRDLDGVSRAHGRVGLTTWAQPYHLKVVKSVAGADVAGMDEARAALLAHMGERIEVGLSSTDGKTYYSEIDLSPQSNRHLGNLKHKESKRLYLGNMRDNLYLPLGVIESGREALARTGLMITHIGLLPFNLFPIDHDWLTPDATVSKETSGFGARVYIFVFFTSLCSCLLGFANLLPFPRLDGGEVALIAGEAWKRRPLVNTEKAAILVFSLLLFYAAVFGANMNDMRGYYLFQIQKAEAASN